MIRAMFTVALLLLSSIDPAAAKEDLQTTSKGKTEKLNAYLETTGMNNPKILNFTKAVGRRVEKDRMLRITDYQMDTGRIVLHYALEPKVSTRQLELKFQPAYSKNTEFIATTKSLMYQYKYSF